MCTMHRHGPLLRPANRAQWVSISLLLLLALSLFMSSAAAVVRTSSTDSKPLSAPEMRARVDMIEAEIKKKLQTDSSDQTAVDDVCTCFKEEAYACGPASVAYGNDPVTGDPGIVALYDKTHVNEVMVQALYRCFDKQKSHFSIDTDANKVVERSSVRDSVDASTSSKTASISASSPAFSSSSSSPSSSSSSSVGATAATTETRATARAASRALQRPKSAAAGKAMVRRLSQRKQLGQMRAKTKSPVEGSQSVALQPSDKAGLQYSTAEYLCRNGYCCPFRLVAGESNCERMLCGMFRINWSRIC